MYSNWFGEMHYRRWRNYKLHLGIVDVSKSSWCFELYGSSQEWVSEFSFGTDKALVIDSLGITP